IYENEGRTAEAESLYQRSLAIREKAFGPDHPFVATALNNIATLYTTLGRHAEAEPILARSLAIRDKSLGPENRDTAVSLNNMADFYASQGRFGDALPFAQRAVANGRALPGAVLPVLFGAQRDKLISADKAMDAALNVVQRGSRTAVAAAVNKLAVRLAAGSDRLAQLVRQDQD